MYLPTITSMLDGDIQVCQEPKQENYFWRNQNLLLKLSTFNQQISSNFGYFNKEIKQIISQIFRTMILTQKRLIHNNIKDKEFHNCHTMKTVWGLVDGQRIFDPIKCKLPIFDSVCNSTHNASKIGCSTFLIVNIHQNPQIYEIKSMFTNPE